MIVITPNYHFSFSNGDVLWNAAQEARGARFLGPTDAYMMHWSGDTDTVAFGTPVTKLTINSLEVRPKMLVDRSGGDSNINFICLSNIDTASAGAFMVWARARGSSVGPDTFQAVQNGDRGGVFRFDAHDGTQFITCGNFYFQVASTPTTGIVSTNLLVSVMDTAGTLFPHVVFRGNGQLGFNPSGGDSITWYKEGGERGNRNQESSGLADWIWSSVDNVNMARVDASANQFNIGTNTQGAIARFGNDGTWLNRLGDSAMDLTVGVDGITDAVKVDGGNKTLAMKIRMEEGKGADVASAGTITLGDGNLFRITGTTTINYITTTNWQAGSIITLDFASTPTVSHNTGSVPGGTAAIYLKSRSNLTATAEDTLRLQYNGTYWKEI